MAAARTPMPNKANGSRAPPPALNPESCALVQPYKDFVGRGFISNITVEFTPLGVKVGCRIEKSLLNDGETTDTIIAVVDAKNRIINKGLWTPGRPGVNKPSATKDLLPQKSICKDDFKGTDDEVKARILAVAKNIGDTTARGRIGSLKMMIEGVDTFENWWKGASASEKSRLLSDKKHHDTFSDADHIRLANLARICPFRGTVPTLNQNEEEEESEAGEPASTALVPSTEARSPRKN
jgi:hypothetical protein